MSFTDAIASCFRQYVGFTGRAMRSEFWWFFLFGGVVLFATAVLESTGAIYLIAALGLLLPSVAVSVRRLHDTSRSGWWLLIYFIPFIGGIVLIVWYATAGTREPNRYGPPPHGDTPGQELPTAPPVTGGAQGARMNCPRCGESVAASAKVCRFCRLEFSASPAEAADPNGHVT